MTRYGPVCELWLDGAWAKPNEDWNIAELYARMARWQPDCVVSVNHTIHPAGKPTEIQLPIDQVVIHEAPVNRPQEDSFTTLHDYHVRAYTVELRVDGQWLVVHQGAGIGAAKRIDLTQVYQADGVKLTITDAVAPPRIAHLAASHRQTRGLRPLYKFAHPR